MSDRVQALDKAIAKWIAEKEGDIYEELSDSHQSFFLDRATEFRKAVLASQGLGWEEAEDKSRGYTSVIFVPLEIGDERPS